MSINTKEKSELITFGELTKSNYNETHGQIEGWISVYDVVHKMPVHSATSKNILADKYLSEDWKNRYPYDDRTMHNYYEAYLDDLIQNGGQVAKDNRAVSLTPEEDWVDIKNCYLNSTEHQRIQTSNTKPLIVKATDLNFHATMIKVGVVEGTNLNDPDIKWLVYEGGGTLCSAAMRGFDKVPVERCWIPHEEYAGEMYSLINKTRTHIQQTDEHTKELNMVPPVPEAVISQKILDDASSDGEIVSYKVDAPLSHYKLELPAVRKILDWRVQRWSSELKDYSTTYFVSGDSSDTKLEDRQSTNYVEAIEIMKEVWPNLNANPTLNKVKLNSNIFKLLSAGLAVVDSKILKTHLLVKMLKKLKDGKISFKNSKLINENEMKASLVNAKTSASLSQSIYFRGFAENDYKYAVKFCILWNHLVEEEQKDSLKVSEDYIQILADSGRLIPHDANRDYEDLINQRYV